MGVGVETKKGREREKEREREAGADDLITVGPPTESVQKMDVVPRNKK